MKNMKRPKTWREVQRDRAYSIVATLNGEMARGREQKRLVEILNDIQKLDAMCTEVRRHSQEKEAIQIGGREISAPRFSDGLEAATKARDQLGTPILNRLNNQLLRSRWSYSLIAPTRRELICIPNFHTKSESASAVERAIFHFLEHYLPSGEIGRFRACPECGKWFFAVTDHQKYCGEKCRLRHVSRSDEFKAKRARYMKLKYRPLIKQLEQRNKPQAAKTKGQ